MLLNASITTQLKRNFLC